ncbi:hypothetical protein [Saccharopolyspora spinosa]|uniref:hypothetical protein n=1 Tax=Saccharopolyspora spinosa TaxID=60894 RepID=UPI00376EFCC7
MEALAGREGLTGEQEVELAELRPKAQQKQKRRKRTRNGTRRERPLPLVLRSWRR